MLAFVPSIQLPEQIFLFYCVLEHPKSFEVKPLTATEGDDVTLICHGTRFLYDTLSWYDSQSHQVQGDSSIQISPYSVSLSLRLKNVSRNNTNGYECRAVNLITKSVVNTTSNLIIDGKLLLLIHEHILHLFTYLHLFMYPFMILWHFPYPFMIPWHFPYSYHIQFVNCSTTCTERRVPWLIQNLTSQDVNSSSTLTLTCQAHGMPPPFITWYKDKIAITEGPGEDDLLFKFT